MRYELQRVIALLQIGFPYVGGWLVAVGVNAAILLGSLLLPSTFLWLSVILIPAFIANTHILQEYWIRAILAFRMIYCATDTVVEKQKILEKSKRNRKISLPLAWALVLLFFAIRILTGGIDYGAYCNP